MTVVSKSQMQAHTFSKESLLPKLVANAAWIVIEKAFGDEWTTVYLPMSV